MIRTVVFTAGAAFRAFLHPGTQPFIGVQRAVAFSACAEPFEWTIGRTCTGPDEVPGVGRQFLDWAAFAALAPHGVWGRPSLASADKGHRALTAAVAATVRYITESFEVLGRLTPA